MAVKITKQPGETDYAFAMRQAYKIPDNLKATAKQPTGKHTAAAHGDKAAHGKLRATGALDQRPVGSSMGLVHPGGVNRAGESQMQTFVSAGTGEKVKVKGAQQSITYMDFIKAGKPVKALTSQLHAGESLVKVGNKLFVLAGVSRDKVESFGGEVLIEK